MNEPSSNLSVREEPVFQSSSWVDQPYKKEELKAPKDFFGHTLSVRTSIDYRCNELLALREASQLREQLSSFDADPLLVPRRVRALEARASVNALLAREAQEAYAEKIEREFPPLPPADDASALREHEEVLHTESDQMAIPSSALEHDAAEATTFSEYVPDSFVTTRTESTTRRIKRKQRQRLAAVAAHQEKAAFYTRQARAAEKMLLLLKEHGNVHKDALRIAGYEKRVRECRRGASYHAVIAQEIINQIHDRHSNAPGAHHVRAEGNYEMELPVRPPSPIKKAQKVKNPREDLIRLSRAKAEPLLDGKVSKMSKKNSKIISQKKVPVAQKIKPKTVEAMHPKDIKLPEAKAVLLK